MPRRKKLVVFTIILLTVFSVAAGVVYWIQAHPSLYIEGIEARITETPSCGPEYCTSSYAAADTDGQKYSITRSIMKGGAPVECLDFDLKDLAIGDRVRFNLYLEPFPANALTTQRTYNTCFPADRNNGYFIKVL